MKFLIIALLLLPFISNAQSEYTLKDINGKWVERTRTDKNSDITLFKDTIYLEIREDGFMLVRPLIGKTYFGDATLDENILKIKDEKFTVESAENDILKLKNGKITHRFVKMKEFTDAPVQKISPGVEKGEVRTSFESLKGKWSVYKKNSEAPDTKKFHIKVLDIREMNMNNLFSGMITMHNMDSVYTSNATVKIQDNEINIATETNVMKGTILKNDGEECILQFGSSVYFMKRFSK